MEKRIDSLEDLEHEAQDFLNNLLPSKEGATLVTLSGELGAGKTAFTKMVAKALGVEDEVTSPTFVLEKVYTLNETSNFTHLVHIDAYRLSGGQELRVLGFNELMKDPRNLILLEWPEQVQDALPERVVKLKLAHTGDGSRTLTYG
jgi:tRNA threonylcarbamoyladenosine biosynthesis protein TsaE